MYREDLNKLAGLNARIKTTSTHHSILSGLTGNYTSGMGGLAMAILLFIPATWYPGLLLLILPMEIYLIDWSYSKLCCLDESKTSGFSEKENNIYSWTGRGSSLSSRNLLSEFTR